MNDANNGSKLYLYSITTVAILGGLLFGYDTAVISGAEKGLEAFFLMATDFQYDKVMHGITSSSALIGCVIGGALSGFFASRLGRRNSLRLASVLFFLSALGSYYPEFLFFNYGEPNMELLIAFNLYRVLGGIGVGLASAVCPMYIAEIAPSNIRGTLVSCNQFAIIFGMLVVYFVNFLIMGDHTNPIIDKSAEGILSVNAASDMWSVQTGWRYMFGSEAFPAALFGFLLFFVPKTPRYLVLVHQDEKAYSILEKVNGANKAKEILAYELTNLVHGEEEAKKAQEGARALFAGGADTAHMPTTELADEDFSEEGTIDLISMLVKAGMVPTRSEGRRAIEQGGVSIDGEKITDVKYTVAKDALTGEGVVLKKGKKKFNKVLAK